MKNPRRRRGFERAGSLPLKQLGLPLGKARELVLEQAWEQVAGRVLARRARVVRSSRGVLEIEVADGPWADAVVELLPRLAGRLAAARPDLGVRKFRFRRSPDRAAGVSREVEAQEEARVEPAVTDPAPSAVAGVESRGERLPELMRAYLDRGKG